MHENIRKKVMYLSWLPALLIAAVIFCFSAQPADMSTEMSDGVTKVLLKFAEMLGLLELSPDLVYELCERLSMPVRKTAHVTEYVILYGTILIGLYYGNDLRKQKLLKYGSIMTVLYAGTDEFHQIFVPGRAGRITDVMIDSIGVLFVTWILWRRYKKIEK